MMGEIYNFIWIGINSVLGYFDQLLSAVPDLWAWVFSFICMFLVSKMLLSPILGHLSLGSDVAGTGLARRKGKSDK